MKTNTCKFLYGCAIIIVLSGYGTSGLPYGTDLYEGSQCKLANGSAGVCKILPECAPILADVQAGRRDGGSGGRCGFKDLVMEIVCCPLEVAEKIFVRAADVACQQYENEVNSDSGDGLERESIDDSKQLTFHILGGTRALAGEFPYMAALGYNNTDGEIDDAIVYICGGALISATHVLTAAHCVSNINKRIPVVVRIGSENTRITGPDTQEIPVLRVITHPSYKRSRNDNDIALLELKNPAKMSNNVKPICLQTKALQNSNVNSNTSFVVIGFGSTEIGGGPSDQLMKTANLNLVAIEECRESYQNMQRLPNGLDDKVICAKDFNLTRNSDACQGDSGGPLLMINGQARYVMGVTAFGQACGTPTPAIYTSVFSYIDWIESHVWPQQSKI